MTFEEFASFVNYAGQEFSVDMVQAADNFRDYVNENYNNETVAAALADFGAFLARYSDVPALFVAENFKTPQKMVVGSAKIASKLAENLDVLIETYIESIADLIDFNVAFRSRLVNWGLAVSAAAASVVSSISIPHAAGFFSVDGGQNYYITGDGGESGGGGASGAWGEEFLPKYPENVSYPLFPPEIIEPRQKKLLPPVFRQPVPYCRGAIVPKIGTVAEIHFFGNPFRNIIKVFWFSNISRLEYTGKGKQESACKQYYKFNDSFLPDFIFQAFTEVFPGAFFVTQLENLQRFSRLVYPLRYFEIIGGADWALHYYKHDTATNEIFETDYAFSVPPGTPAECLGSVPGWPSQGYSQNGYEHSFGGYEYLDCSGQAWQDTFLLSCVTCEVLGSCEITPDVEKAFSLSFLHDVPLVGVKNYVNNFV